MNPILYDMIKTLKNKWMIILTAVIILISLAVIPLVQSVIVSMDGVSSYNTTGYLYYENGYHIVTFSFNQFGIGIPNVKIVLNITGNNVNVSKTIISNSTGYGSLYLNLTKSNYNLYLNWSYPGSNMLFSSVHFIPETIMNSTLYPLVGMPFALITDQKNASMHKLLLYYPALNYSKNENLSVYYYVYGENNQNKTFLGSFTPNITVYNLPSFNNYSSRSDIVFALYSNNSLILDTIIPVSFLKNQVISINSESLGASFISSILTLFYPLIAILSAYSAYGKDRVTGVIESVLSRPITRTKLTLSRFVSIMIAIAISITITILTVSYLISSTLHVPMFSFSFTLYSILALLVDTGAFVLLIFIFSHLVKSTSALIGISIALFVIFDFFWGLIVFAVSEALGYGILSFNYYRVDVILSYINPAQFYSLVSAYLTGSYGGFSSDPSVLGINPVNIVIAGILWIVVPLAILYYLAKYRD